MSSPASTSGPLGQPRGIGFVILIFIITFGIYGIYWAYKTHEELKVHTGEGLGGVLGLVICILIWPGERLRHPIRGREDVQARRARAARDRLDRSLALPRSILVIPAIVWFVKVQGALNRYWESKAAAAPVQSPAVA